MSKRMATVVLVLSTIATSASASAASSAEVSRLVERKVLGSMNTSQEGRIRFSRKAVVASVRRVQVADATEKVDTHGDHFVEFTIEESFRSHGEWRAEMTGCAYPADQRVYVRRDDAFYDSKTLASRRAAATPVDVVCRAVGAEATAVAPDAPHGFTTWLASTLRSVLQLVATGWRAAVPRSAA